MLCFLCQLNVFCCCLELVHGAVGESEISSNDGKLEKFLISWLLHTDVARVGRLVVSWRLQQGMCKYRDPRVVQLYFLSGNKVVLCLQECVCRPR